MSDVVEFSDLTRFSEQGPRLSRDELRVVWKHLMTRSSHWERPVRFIGSQSGRVSREAPSFADEAGTLTRSWLLVYGAHLRDLSRRLSGFFAETRGLSTDECSLLMDWLRELDPLP